MRVATLLKTDDAVSPVLGVILMVAVTVLLAAVIAAFAFQFGDTGERAPNPTFDTKFEGQLPAEVTISMTGSDSFIAGRVSVTGENIDASDEGKAWHELDNPYSNPGPGSRIMAGDKAVIELTDTEWEITLVWADESGATSATLFKKSSTGI
jgi:FlaG/FlaF family flagellin (archaellin)